MEKMMNKIELLLGVYKVLLNALLTFTILDHPTSDKECFILNKTIRRLGVLEDPLFSIGIKEFHMVYSPKNL